MADKVVVTQPDSGELTDQEIAELLASSADVGAEGGAQIVDADGNVITVTAEQLAAAGIDIENMGELTEDQLNHLLHLANEPRQPHATQRGAEVKAAGGAEASQEEEAGAGDLTMVIGDDGSLRLVDPSGAEFSLTPAQLAEHGIDVNDLTEDSIQAVLQLAAPNLDSGEPPAKQARHSDHAAASSSSAAALALDPNTPAIMRRGTARLTALQQQKQMQEQEAAAAAAAAAEAAAFAAAAAPPPQSTAGYALIGQEVQVKKGGRTYPATIRYCRHGHGYKVQFDDGHFEWVTEEQIQIRPGALPKQRAADHGSYAGGSSTANAASATVDDGGELGSSGVRRRVPPAIPGIRVSGHKEDVDEDPNFNCPICDRKLYQKEPAYIVIRLPACDSCADSRILVLDQDEEPETAVAVAASAAADAAPEPNH